MDESELHGQAKQTGDELILCPDVAIFDSLDLSLPNLERTTAIELANDLAHRLPVVVLTGTEAFDEEASQVRARLKACVEQADLPGKLLSAIRRSRRLGTGIMAPIFCRIEGLCV